MWRTIARWFNEMYCVHHFVTTNAETVRRRVPLRSVTGNAVLEHREYTRECLECGYVVIHCEPDVVIDMVYEQDD